MFEFIHKFRLNLLEALMTIIPIMIAIIIIVPVEIVVFSVYVIDAYEHIFKGPVIK
jgi:hypothetical protein